MTHQVEVAKVDQLGPGQRRLVRVRGLEIVLFNLAGQIYAISNTCPHSRGPLSEGRLHGTVVTCPWHGAKFNITTGACLAGPATDAVATYPVDSDGINLLIEVP
jgi:nitrite reductase/ring-hydroxylating ferredoxin subunit